MGCYIWYSDEGTYRGPNPPRPLLAVQNVTAHPSTASVPITVALRFYFNAPIKGLRQKTAALATAGLLSFSCEYALCNAYSASGAVLLANVAPRHIAGFCHWPTARLQCLNCSYKGGRCHWRTHDFSTGGDWRQRGRSKPRYLKSRERSDGGGTADTEARCRLRSASSLLSYGLSAVHGCQPSVTELFRSPFLVLGTVFRSTSRQHRHWPSSADDRQKTHLFRCCFPSLYRFLVVPEKWHVTKDTLIGFYLLTYLLTYQQLGVLEERCQLP